MNFMDFTDYLNKYFACAGSWFTESYENFGIKFSIPPFGNSNVFFLGDLNEYENALKPIWDDVTQDREFFLPMPFGDVSMVSHRTMAGTEGMQCDRFLLLPEEVKQKLISLLKYRIEIGGILHGRENVQAGKDLLERDTKTVKAYLYLEVFETMFKMSTVMGAVFLYGGGRLVLDERRETLPGAPFCAIPPDARTSANPYYLAWTNDHNKIIGFISQDTLACCELLTSISHPTNYIVKTSPALTVKEKHRLSSGHSLSPRKRPYFIIVDHDVLVRMRRGIPAQGEEIDRASPTPHHRRGHWRRLSERCRHARLLGKDRILVREAFIGDTKFSDEKNFYEVMLNFNSKNTT